MPPASQPTRRPWYVRIPVIIATMSGLFALGLWWYQDDLVYLRRGYAPADLAAVPASVVPLRFRSGEQPQLAFWRPPPAGGRPERLWLVFGGNAARALDWVDVTADSADRGAGFLLIDYPGYGGCGGTPSPASILAASEDAVAALATLLGETPEALAARGAVFGHSLGCAAALQYAARSPVRRVVLVSPFTSLGAMARRQVGWPLCHLLSGDFDNHARLAELLARSPAPPVTLFHGDADEIIPVAMGRALAAAFPAIVYREVPADHNGIIASQWDALRAELAAPR